MNEPTPSDTPETDAPCGDESVTPQQIRQIVERLFHTPMSLSLKQWGPIGSSLLGAATKIETLERQRNEARAERDKLADEREKLINLLSRINDGFWLEPKNGVSGIANAMRTELVETLNQKDQ